MLSVDEINKLKAENARLKELNKNLLKEIAEFTVANRMLQEVTKHQRQTLQEIKEIAEKEYNKKLVEKDCFDCDASFSLIIDLITKTESEG